MLCVIFETKAPATIVEESDRTSRGTKQVSLDILSTNLKQNRESKSMQVSYDYVSHSIFPVPELSSSSSCSLTSLSSCINVFFQSNYN